jgi:hypothetical protein
VNETTEAIRVPAKYAENELATQAFKHGYTSGQRRYRALKTTDLDIVIPPEFSGKKLASDAWMAGQSAGYLVEYDRQWRDDPPISSEFKEAVEKSERDDPSGDGIRGAMGVLVTTLLMFLVIGSGCCSTDWRKSHGGPIPQQQSSQAPAEEQKAEPSEALVTEVYGERLPNPKLSTEEQKTREHYFEPGASETVGYWEEDPRYVDTREAGKHFIWRDANQ